MLARKISASSGVSAGRNGRRPAGDLAGEFMGPPLFCPPPLAGEGKEDAVSRVSAPRAAPSPTLLRKRGREPAVARGKSSPKASSRNLPGGAVLGVLEHHAHGGEFVADAVGLGKVLCRAGYGPGLNEGVDSCVVNCTVNSLASRMPFQVSAASCFEQPQEFCRRLEPAFKFNLAKTGRRAPNLAGNRVKPRQRAWRVEIVAKRLQHDRIRMGICVQCHVADNLIPVI